MTVVLTLGLGIGANAAVFTIVNRLLLKPLPVRDAGGLFVLAVQHEGNEDPHNVSWLDYLDYRDKSGAFAELAGYDIGFVGMSADNRAERVTVSYVTSNYFSMLGVPPALGRVLQPSDPIQPGAAPFVVLGHTYWMKRFNGDAGVVGRRVLVNGTPFTVAGVVPAWFEGTYALVEFDAYMPLSMLPDRRIQGRDDEARRAFVARDRAAEGGTRATAGASRGERARDPDRNAVPRDQQDRPRPGDP